MSSAILYLAIVAIWACVLIPRWLRRDSAHGGVTASSDAAAPDGFAAPGAVPDDAEHDATGVAGVDGGVGVNGGVGLDGADGAGDTVAAARPGDPGGAPRPQPAPLNAEEARRRMLAARRRLLGMLIALEAAAITLAFLRLAAMWVVVPPTIMLTGYLLLLREAAHADAEYAQREAEAAARARAMTRSRHDGRAGATQNPTPAEGTPLAGIAAAAAAAAAAADLAARFAAAPVPADYEDSGRDFAPGLAGKYTPSSADSELTDEERYGYEEPRLRAVGD